MDRGTISGALRQRLSLQDDVLKRIEEFAAKMQRRAEEVTTELHGLEDQARTAEMELKGALSSFRELSEYRMVEHRISEEESSSSGSAESAKDAAATGVRAQSYEEDILPRYQEALSLGLASCREYMKNSNRLYPGSFTFNRGVAHGPLPHIIGSEEYIHDNSSDLIDQYPLDSKVDLNWRIEERGFRSASEHLNFNEPTDATLFRSQEVPSRKEGDGTLESAALEFKAMLEAALLNPYKFYDEQETTKDSKVTCHPDESQLNAALDSTTHSSGLVSTEGTKPQAQSIPHDISSLLSGSLFDAEEELNFSFENPFATSVAGVVQDTTSEIKDYNIPVRPSNLPDPPNLSSEEIHVLEHGEFLSSLRIADEIDKTDQESLVATGIEPAEPSDDDL